MLVWINESAMQNNYFIKKQTYFENVRYILGVQPVRSVQKFNVC